MIRSHEFGNMIYQKLSVMFPMLNLADTLENNGKNTAGYPLPHYNNNSGLAKNVKGAPSKKNNGLPTRKI